MKILCVSFLASFRGFLIFNSCVSLFRFIEFTTEFLSWFTELCYACESIHKQWKLNFLKSLGNCQ